MATFMFADGLACAGRYSTGEITKVAENMFERLLKALPDIASAVNQFESPAVQEQAFEALIQALGLAEPPVAAPAAPAMPGMGFAVSANGDLNGGTGEAESKTGIHTSAARRRRRRSPQATMPDARDIEFRPDGKQSLRDFVAKKKPGIGYERNVVAVYYLEQILNLPAINVGHVLGVYKECGWPEPNDLVNALSVTAYRKHWLDTRDKTALRTTAQGRNHVKHDMPAKEAAKK